MSTDRQDSDRSGEQRQAGPDPRPSDWLGRLKTLMGLRSGATIRAGIEDALAIKDEGDSFTAQERAMLRNILGLRTVRVADVMVPRADIVAIPADIRLGDLLKVFRTQGHSRLPAYGQNLDDPRGMVHIRDFLDYITNRAEAGERRRRRKQEADAVLDLGLVDLTAPLQSARILRPVLYAPPSMPAMDLLVSMQTTRTHMALVIDEYGGTDGLVSIEDLVEMIVGDIEDEHDEAAGPAIETAPDGSCLADARASLEELSTVLDLDLASAVEAEDVETIGGLIATVAQRLPSRGELIAGPFDLEFEILDADPRRIKRVKIHRRRQERADDAAALAAARKDLPSGAMPSMPLQVPGAVPGAMPAAAPASVALPLPPVPMSPPSTLVAPPLVPLAPPIPVLAPSVTLPPLPTSASPSVASLSRFAAAAQPLSPLESPQPAPTPSTPAGARETAPAASPKTSDQA